MFKVIINLYFHLVFHSLPIYAFIFIYTIQPVTMNVL